jgi:YihY family inner membrane protein
MDFKAIMGGFDRFQQRHRWLAVPMAVVKKAGDDQGGHLAALVAYYGFFSLFPLLLVFTTILGYVLAGDPAHQRSIEKSLTDQFPSIGHQLPINGITGSALALVLGLLTSLYAGLGVTSASKNLLDKVWAVPLRDRASFVQSRLRGLGLLLLLGVLFVISTFVTGAVSSTFGGTAAKIGGYVVSLILNAGLFFAAFRLMTDGNIPSRDLRSGTLVGSVLWTFLQSIATIVLHNAGSGNYGIFVTVIPLIVWLHLGGQVFLYSAEVNVVVSRRLWPRSFFGPPDAPADKRALRALARVEERFDGQRIDVEFPPSEIETETETETEAEPEPDAAA